jgi:hypothetical protein
MVEAYGAVAAEPAIPREVGLSSTVSTIQYSANFLLDG